MLPPSFFDHLEDRLNIAVYDINADHRMGATSDLRAHLDNPEVRIRFGPNQKYVTIGDKTIEFNPNATDDEIAHALNIQKIDQITATKPGSPMSNVTGIQAGAFQAKLSEMRQKIADKQTEALTKIDGAVTSGAAKMNAAVDDVITKADKEVDAALHEFAQFTNGPEA